MSLPPTTFKSLTYNKFSGIDLVFCVGLTGGIGSGKTTVSNAFHELGITIIDTDVIAREVVAKGTPCLHELEAHFGASILTANNELDRKKLREIIFSDAEEKRWVEALLHPVIQQQTQQELAASQSTYSILSSPLLLESPDAARVDRILVVDIPEAEQVKRTKHRDGVSEQQIENTMTAQLPRAQRLAKADDILDNSGSIENTRKQVKALDSRYRELARTHSYDR